MKVGQSDDLEQRYMAKFREIAAHYGTFVEYSTDRAARDIGLHFTQPLEPSGKIVTPALVWFQMKGISSKALSLEAYESKSSVTLSLQTNHLRFWYVALEPTYLAVYVESAEKFLVMNIKEWVRSRIGEDILTSTKQTYSVSIDRKNILDDHAFQLMLRNNLVSIVRTRLGTLDDEEASRFLKGSEVVKWIDASQRAGIKTRVSVKSWLSKMRTEVAFLSSAQEEADWLIVREHWEYCMPPLTETFPFLAITGGRVARFSQGTVSEGDSYSHRRIVDWVNPDTADSMDGEELDPDGWLDLGGDLYSYGDVAGGEWVSHELDIALNDLGASWLKTLTIMEKAEIIAVGKADGWVSVAPWHARDL